MSLMTVYFQRGRKLHEKCVLGSVCSVPGKASLGKAVRSSLNLLPETLRVGERTEASRVRSGNRNNSGSLRGRQLSKA